MRPIMLKLDPERAHELLRKTLKFPLPFLKYSSSYLKVKIGDLELENPLGLAAGFDKNAEMVSFLSSIGFGYITLGSVLVKPNEGNPRPRIARYARISSMTNAMGLPSVGLRKFLKNLSKQRSFVPISISIAGNSLEEYKTLYDELSKWAKMIELNLSCPNTENGMLFQNPENFERLSYEISKIKRGIVFAKISPSLSYEDCAELVSLCIKRKIEGITAVNTLQVKDPNLSIMQGGLSGKLLRNAMLKTVKRVYELSEGNLIINACGGIFSGYDAFKAIINGANTLQIYTALIYEGIGAPRRILKELEELIRKKGFSSLNEARGYALR